jgi:Family of unknown function (DUF6326)
MIRGALMRARLSALWIFAALNYLYCDVVSLMDAGLLRQYLTGTVNGMELNQGFLLGAAALVEIPIAMTLVSRLVAHHAANRWANLVAAAVMTLVQAATLFVGTPAPYYAFFSVLEIGCTAAIAWQAWSWRVPEPAALVAV